MRSIVALGAEAQAATSLASAYPDNTVIFVSDRDILDGADLPNVRMVLATPSEKAKFAESADDVVPLCPRWVDGDTSLSSASTRLARDQFGRVIPVSYRPGASGRWHVKGDRWHRPDNPLAGNAGELADVADTHGCGLIYQPHVEAAATIMTIGRRYEGGAALLGVIDVFDERFFRDVILQAAETIDAPDVVELSLEVLDMLDHRGFFTLNWLRTGDGLRLTSFRPVPRAIFQIFRRAGVDLLAPTSAMKVVPAGLRFIANPHYVSFERLRA
jgi:hypothetical protein